MSQQSSDITLGDLVAISAPMTKSAVQAEYDAIHSGDASLAGPAADRNKVETLNGVYLKLLQV